jgi:hypothetical protein
MRTRTPRSFGAEVRGETKNTRQSVVADEATEMREKTLADEAMD